MSRVTFVTYARSTRKFSKVNQNARRLDNKENDLQAVNTATFQTRVTESNLGATSKWLFNLFFG